MSASSASATAILTRPSSSTQRHGGLPNASATLTRCSANVGMDALYVCLPPGAHNGQTEAAAARGLHLFLEKPIALT